MRTRFWFETALAVFNALLLALTLVWNDWIELVFRVDPDAGSGALERSILAVTLALSLACLWLARQEWRRANALTP